MGYEYNLAVCLSQSCEEGKTCFLGFFFSFYKRKEAGTERVYDIIKAATKITYKRRNLRF